MPEFEYARDEDERCWHEECWRRLGHRGKHAYHPAFSGATTHRPETTTDAREANPHG